MIDRRIPFVLNGLWAGRISEEEAAYYLKIQCGMTIAQAQEAMLQAMTEAQAAQAVPTSSPQTTVQPPQATPTSSPQATVQPPQATPTSSPQATVQPPQATPTSSPQAIEQPLRTATRPKSKHAVVAIILVVFAIGIASLLFDNRNPTGLNTLESGKSLSPLGSDISGFPLEVQQGLRSCAAENGTSIGQVESEQDLCYSDLASTQNDPRVCGFISSGRLKSDCYDHLALVLREVLLCDHVDDKDRCVQDVRAAIAASQAAGIQINAPANLPANPPKTTPPQAPPTVNLTPPTGNSTTPNPTTPTENPAAPEAPSPAPVNPAVFSCVTDSDCVLQETGCNGCGCPVAINKNFAVPLPCSNDSSTYTCNLYCRPAVPACVNGVCIGVSR